MAAPLLRKYSKKIPLGLLRILINAWPPFVGAGVRITNIGPHFQYLKVTLKLAWYNTNYVGTQFGGSIYAMTDPFYMLMIMNNLGKEYVVWDKAAKIEFVQPGRSRLYAEFRIDDKMLAEIKERTAKNEKYVFDLPVDVKDEKNQIVANVTKTLFVRKKKSAES